MFGFIKRKCTAETLGTIVKKEMEWQFMVYYSRVFRGRTIIYRQRAAHLSC